MAFIIAWVWYLVLFAFFEINLENVQKKYEVIQETSRAVQ